MRGRSGGSITRWAAAACTVAIVATSMPVRADGWDYVYGDPGPANYSRYQDVEIAPDGSVFTAGFYSGSFNGLNSPDAYRYFVQHIRADGTTAWTREVATAALATQSVPKVPELVVDGLGNPIFRLNSFWAAYSPAGDIVTTTTVGSDLLTSTVSSTPLIGAPDGGVAAVVQKTAPVVPGTQPGFELQRRRADLSLQWTFDLGDLIEVQSGCGFCVAPALMAVSDGSYWVVGTRNRRLATQADALSMVHIGADGTKITSILHNGMTPQTNSSATSPLLAATDSFIWVSVRIGDTFTAPAPVVSFATSDGHQLGPVSAVLPSDDITTPVGVVNCGGLSFVAENELNTTMPPYPPAVAVRRVLVNGTRLVLVARCSQVQAGGGLSQNNSILLLSYSTSGPLGGNYALTGSRQMSSTSTIYAMDADDAGNAVVVGSTTSGIVYAGPIEKNAPRTEVAGNEQAVATRNPLGNLNVLREYSGTSPIRLFDTRPGEPNGAVGVEKAKIGADKVLTVKVAGKLGVPANGAGAVSLNVTVVDPSGAGYLTVYPCGTPPNASNLNFAPGQTVANAVIAPLSAAGEVCFASNSTTHVLADINGWFRAGLGFAAVSPLRVFDTRPEQPQGAVPVEQHVYGGGVQLKVKVAGVGGVPLTNVGAVSLNVTAVGPTGAGYVTVYPCGTPPNASNLNFVTGQTVPNAVIAPVSANGEVCFYSSVDTHLLADVNGWFAVGSSFNALTPVRLVDSRPTEGQGAVVVTKQKYGPTSVLRVKVTGAGGVPAMGVGAIALNVTVVDPDGAGYLTAFPCGERPLASNVNYSVGQTVPNAVVVPVSAAGEVCFFSNVPAHILVDVNGWISA